MTRDIGDECGAPAETKTGPSLAPFSFHPKKATDQFAV
jgi:hypothetical protein